MTLLFNLSELIELTSSLLIDNVHIIGVKPDINLH